MTVPADLSRYFIRRIWSHVPTQADGRTKWGRPFYFRARHGHWTLELGPYGAGMDYLEWQDDAELVAEGNDPTGGWMEDDEVRSILNAHMPS